MFEVGQAVFSATHGKGVVWAVVDENMFLSFCARVPGIHAGGRDSAAHEACPFPLTSAKAC